MANLTIYIWETQQDANCEDTVTSVCIKPVFGTNYLMEEKWLKKVKLSLYRPWRPLGLREVEAPTFSDIQLTNGSKAVSPMRRPLFSPRKISGTHDPRAIVRLEGLGKLKKSTSSGTQTSDLLACSIVPQQTTLP
jgi:hypothetical protein